MSASVEERALCVRVNVPDAGLGGSVVVVYPFHTRNFLKTTVVESLFSGSMFVWGDV